MSRLLSILSLIILSQQISSFAKYEIDECKIRLPNTINRYQNIVTPVITPDGSRLYFDRKWHPENRGGVQDQDDIWFSDINQNGIWSEAQNAGLPLNSNQSDVLFSISPCGNRALFYSSRRDEKFYFLKPANNGWTIDEAIKIENFYNKSGNFFGFLSSDARYLLTALERGNSFGKLDIYLSKQINNNHYSEPINLGPIINDKNRQVSPFLAYDGKTLYFSTDRNSNNLDLYFSRRLDDTWSNWSEPISLGQIANTEFDESSIYLNLTGDTAYIVSSDTIVKRPGIYQVCMPDFAKPLPYLIVKSRLIDENDSLIVNNASILVEFSDNFKQTVYPNIKTGVFTFIVPNDDTAVFYAKFQNKISEIKTATSRELTNIKVKEFDIIFQNKVVEPVFQPIYFNTASYEISPKDIALLKKNAKQFLESKSNTQLKVVGFADLRGSDDYNMVLSLNRAEAVKMILIDSGIDSNRIEIIGKGKSEQKSDILSENRRVDIILMDVVK